MAPVSNRVKRGGSPRLSDDSSCSESDASDSESNSSADSSDDERPRDAPPQPAAPPGGRSVKLFPEVKPDDDEVRAFRFSTFPHVRIGKTMCFGKLESPFALVMYSENTTPEQNNHM